MHPSNIPYLHKKVRIVDTDKTGRVVGGGVVFMSDKTFPEITAMGFHYTGDHMKLIVLMDEGIMNWKVVNPDCVEEITND